jgi:hypothetical protein
MLEECPPKTGFQVFHSLMVSKTCFHYHILFFILMKKYDS